MHVSKIKAEGFRSFVDEVAIDDLNKVNVFIGKNNVGKTNALEIFLFLRELSKGAQYRPPADYFSKDKKNLSLSLEFVLEEHERKELIKDLFQQARINETALNEIEKSKFLRIITHRLKFLPEGIEDETVSISNIIDGDAVISHTFLDEKGNRTLVQGCDFLIEGERIELIRNLQVSLVDRYATTSLTWGILEPAVQSPGIVIKILRKFYNNIEWVPPIRQVQPKMPVKEMRKLDNDGSNLTQVWNTIVSDEPAELVKIQNEMKSLSPYIASIQAPLRGSEAGAFIKEPTGHIFDFSNTSSGIHQAAILVTKIATCPKGGMILIEEPELHLHASAQRALRQLIEEYSKNIRFFITTHSTIFANITPNSKVYLVTKKDVQSSLKLVKEPEEFRSIKWELGHSNTDLYGFNLVVFIEGDSESIALPIIVESLGYDLAQSGIKLINVQGSGKAKKIGQYLEYLKDSDTTPFIIMDGNKEVKRKIEDWERSNLLPNGNYQMWDLEFEDIFSPELITECCAELGYGGVTIAKLKQSNNSSSVVPILKKILREQEKELDKPALTETIAKKIARDKEHLPTELKETIKKIFQLVESRLRASNIN